MTGNTQTALAASLAVLMVTSVAVVGVSAGDAGATTASVSSAVEYSGNIELALSEGSSVTVAASDVNVWVDGAPKTVDVRQAGSEGRIALTGLDDVAPHESLTVNVNADGLDTDNVSVTVTGASFGAGPERNLFKGADVAYVASGTGVPFELFRGNEFLASRNTGTNSKVYVLDTSSDIFGPPSPESYFVNETGGADVTTEFHLRDLGLTASTNATEVPGGGGVEITATSKSSDRPIVVELVDVSDGSVVRTKEGRMGGTGEGSVTFNGLTEGTYRAVVEDADTGITARTSQITVGAVEEGSVEFATGVVTDQRGDVVDIPLSFQGSAEGGTGTVTLGSSDLNFEVQFTVADSDGDGSATVHWNVADSAASDAGVSVSGGSLQSVEVVSGVAEPVVTGEYPLSVSYGGTETDVATAVIEQRSVDGISTYTAPGGVPLYDSATEARSSATQSDTVALDQLTGTDDWAIIELSATGLEGYVESVDDLDGANGVSVSIVESEATTGPNEDPLTVDVSRTTLLVDGNNDSYVLAFKADELTVGAEPGDKFVVNLTVAGSNPATASTQTVTKSFTFVNGTASFDAAGGELTLPAEEGATVSGQSTFAAGTELTVVLRSEGGQSPFIKDADGITVGADGSWSATFDLSDQQKGTTFTAMVKKEGKTRSSIEGTLGDTAASTPTGGSTPATTEPGGTTETTEPGGTTETTEPGGTTETTEPTPTTSPGLGLVVALLAVVAAGLLLRRR